MFSHGCEGDAARQRCFCPCTAQGGEGSAFGAARIKGDILFRKREYPLWNPKRKALIGSFGLERLLCLRNGTACARRCRVRTARRFASASIIRCRSADLVEVQTNFRLPRLYSMRRAPAMPHSASSLPPSKRHSRLTIVRRGCWMCRIAGIHGEAMYTAPDCAARAVIRASGCQCAGSRGKAPCVLLGDLKGAILSRERMAPFNAPPARCRDKSSAAALHHPRALAARFNL